MTVLGEGASQEAPSVIHKTFVIIWNGDHSPAEYPDVVASNMENDVLFLIEADGTEQLINMMHVRRVSVWNNDDQDS